MYAHTPRHAGFYAKNWGTLRKTSELYQNTGIAIKTSSKVKLQK